MAQLYPIIGCFNPDVMLLFGRLVYDGAGAPSRVKGLGYSIADNGAGLFTVTVDKPFQHVLFVGGSRECVIGGAVGGNVQLVKGSEDTAARTFQVRIMGDADAAEDPANGDGVGFMAALQMSGLPG